MRNDVLAILKKHGFVDRVEVQFKHKDGRPYDCLLSLRSITYKEKPCTQAIVLDVTRLKKIEKLLWGSRERFLSLVETTSDWIWEVDRTGTYIYSNQKVKDILGYDRHEVLGKKPFDFMPPDEAHKIAQAFRKFSKSRKAFSGMENINLHRDGHEVVLETGGVPIFNESGEYLGFTPTEIKVANLIKQGKTTNDIAELSNLSPRTVEFHRDNFRTKLGIKNKKVNLRTHLLSID